MVLDKIISTNGYTVNIINVLRCFNLDNFIRNIVSQTKTLFLHKVLMFGSDKQVLTEYFYHLIQNSSYLSLHLVSIKIIIR